MIIESSYRIINGTASKNCEITSGGVIIAAKTKNVTIRGNWKLIPSAKVSKKTK